MKWNDSYRKLFFDFHNYAQNHSLASEFDAEIFAQKLEEVGCEMVSVFCLGGRGHKYYRKGKYGTVHPYLPEGIDMVEDVVRECHKRNIKVLGYVCYGMSNEFLLENPQYIQMDEPGVCGRRKDRFNTLTVCNIGAGTEYLLKMYEELCANYELDFFFLDGSYNHDPCYCETCMKNFKGATGHDIPLLLEPNSEIWPQYYAWYQEEMEKFRAKVREVVRKARPGIESTVNWSNCFRSPDTIKDDIDMLFCDVPFPNELEGIDICTRHYALTGKKFEIHNTAFLKQWGEWGLKHTNVLKRAAALLLANGTNVHMGYQFHPKFRVENGVWNAFKDVFDWVKPHEKYLQNNEIVPFIGSYMSNTHIVLSHPTKNNKIRTEPIWLFGFNKMMIDSGLHYNMLGAEQMKDTINNFSAVFLPDMRYISDSQVEILKDYVKNGGTVVATGLSGTTDEMGHYQGTSNLSELLGIEWSGVYEHPHSYLKITDKTLAQNTSDMPLTMEAETALVKATTAKSLGKIHELYLRDDGGYALNYSPSDNETEFDGVTINEYGKGKAIFFANEICLAYYKTFQWNITELIKNVLFDIANVPKKVFATGDGAVELTLAKRGDATQVHIVNMLGTLPAVQQTTPCCMPKEIYDIHDVKIEAIHHKKATKVVLVPSNKEIPFTTDGNKVMFTLEKLGLYEIAEIY